MTLAADSPRMVLPAVFKLLRLQILISYNGFIHARMRVKLLTILGAVAILAFAVFVFWISRLILGFLTSPRLAGYLGSDLGVFLRIIPSFIFTSVFIGILLTSFGVLLQSMYLSGDMDFLLAAPVPLRAVFVAKLLQAILPNFGLAALFGLPILYGLGFSAGYNFLYYPLVVVVMILLALVAAGVSALLVMLVVRIFPARRVAEVLGFVGALSSMLCSQTGNMSIMLGRGARSSGSQFSGLIDFVARFDSPWVPLNWVGRSLVDIGEGNWVSGFLLFLLVAGGSCVFFWLALNTAERWYYTGWAGLQVVDSRKKINRQSASAAGRSSFLNGLAESLLPAQVRAIIVRDFTILTRDLRLMSQLLSPVILGLIYTFSLFRRGTNPADLFGASSGWLELSVRSVLVYTNVGMSLFVGWMLLNQLAGNGVSREGKNYWILKAAPLSTGQFLLAKFLVAYFPALGMGSFFLIGISILQKVSIDVFVYGFLAIALCLAGMDGILLGFGTMTANLEWQNSRRINSGSMGCLGSVMAGLFLPFGFGLFIVPLWGAVFFHYSIVYGYLAGFIIGLAACGIAIWLPLQMASTRIPLLGENE